MATLNATDWLSLEQDRYECMVKERRHAQEKKMSEYAAQQREPFRLLDLPLEIRDQIYRYTLRDDSQTVQSSLGRNVTDHGISMIYVLMVNCLRPSMLLVNKQIHDEYLETAYRHMILSLYFEADPNKTDFVFLPLPEYTDLPKSVHDRLLAAEFDIEYHNDGPHFPPMASIENLSAHLPSLRTLSLEVDLDERRLSEDAFATPQRLPDIDSLFILLPTSTSRLTVAPRLIIATELFTMNDRYTFADQAEHDHVCEMWDSGWNLVRFRGTPCNTPEAGPYAYHGLDLEMEVEPSNLSWQQLWDDVKISSTPETKAAAWRHWEWFKR